MGTWLSSTGVIGVQAALVEEAVGNYARERHGRFQQQPGKAEEAYIAVMAEGSGGTILQYPHHQFVLTQAEDLSKLLSQKFQTAVFQFEVYHGDCWMFWLFDKGQSVANFNPFPDHLEEWTPEMAAYWRCDAKTVVKHVPAINENAIERYFATWTETVRESGLKAYPDDECCYGDGFQLFDFMSRFGLRQPRITGEEYVDGKTFFMDIPFTVPKPWWKFW